MKIERVIHSSIRMNDFFDRRINLIVCYRANSVLGRGAPKDGE